jgi:hypothetical protein
MARIDIKSNGATLNDGVLQLENGVAMDSTLRNVADQNNTTSPLKISTTAVQVVSPLRITTDDPSDMYLDCEDGSANNRFNITRNTASQQVNLNFASNPAGSTTTVGAIRTFTDGVNLGEVVKFREDGQVTFTERVNVDADSLVTTQGSSVIAATTTNANLVIAPNGTGALVASIPDGTATGGNARGQYAVDLQTLRGANTQVTSGNYAVISGGQNNTATGQQSFIGGGFQNSTTDSLATTVGGRQNTAGYASFMGGGQSNNASAFWGVCVGGQRNTSIGYGFVGGGLDNSIATGGYSNIVGGELNVVNTGAGTNAYSVISGGRSNSITSAYSTVSGGQSNTASTGTHATVSGGFNNTASGQYATVTGGQSNLASGNYAFAHGFQCVAMATGAAALNNGVAASQYSMAINGGSVAATSLNINGSYAFAHGASSRAYLYAMQANAGGSFSGVGQAQQSNVTARREASLNSGAITVLSLDGTGTTNLIVPEGNNRVWNVVASWTAVVTAITGTATGVSVGDVATECNLFAFKKIAGVSSIVGTVTSVASHNDASMATAAMGYTAGASQELIPTFSAPIFVGGGSLTIRVVLKLMLTEVAY